MQTAQSKEDKVFLVKYWLEHVQTIQFPGFVDNDSNSRKIHDYIYRNLGNVYSLENISAAVEALKSNLVGLGVASPEQDAAQRARQEAARKAEELQTRIDADMAVASNYIKNYAPTGLICGTDFYGATSDKIIAFIKNKYPGQALSNEQITDAIRTLWNSLDFFDRSDAALQFRNIAKPERKLSQQARIDAGIETPRLKGHENDGKFVDPNEKLRTVVKKLTGGMESPDQTACEQLSVTNRHGRIDHGFVAKLRETFAHNRDGSVNWAETRRLRVAACDSYEKQRNR